MSVSVLLAEDHTLVRAGLLALLQSSGKVRVVGEAADGREAVRLAEALQPQVVVMDLAMPNLNGIEATRQIRQRLPDVRVLILSMHHDRQHIIESLRVGAAGYLLKDSAFTELVTAIETVVSGRTYMSPAVAEVALEECVRRVSGEPGASELEKLSGREREILQLIAEGKGTSEIGQTLHISPNTVDTHRRNIMKKLGITHLAGLVKFAIRHGLAHLD